MTKRKQVGFSRLISAWYGMASPFIGSAVGGDGRTRSDIKEINDGFDSGVEDEAARARAHVIALGGRCLRGVRRQQARHAEQRLAEAILQHALVVREDQRFALALVDVK